MARPKIHILISLSWFLVLNPNYVYSQVSNPKARNTPEDLEENKFRQRKADLDGRKDADDEFASVKFCSFDLHMRWMTEVSSTVYGTPLITDLFSDGHKDIIVPSFSKYLEVLEAEDGAKAVGFPAYHNGHIHGSPIMFDIDRDGVLDIGAATYEGQVVWFKDTGERIPQTLYIPKLRVKKDWYVGLNPDPTDHEHPDVGDGNVFEAHGKGVDQGSKGVPVNRTQGGGLRRLKQVDTKNTATAEQHDGGVSKESTESFDVFDDSVTYETLKNTDEETNADQGRYQYDLDDYGIFDEYARDDFWDKDEVLDHERQKPDTMSSDGVYVHLDAHVLTTPVIADLDGDGVEELVIPVTYYFDEDHYKMPEHKDELAEGIDVSKYLANGIVVFDLYHKFVKWDVHLDLTTDTIDYRAYLFTPPSIVDIDEDGKMEIVVGTGHGFVYVLDHKGNTRQGWPIQMGQIEGQVLVDDVNGDGKIEIVAADRRGSVAMFDIDGKELWERHLRTSISQPITAGDIDGDGKIEVVVASRSGNVFALSGVNGEDKAPFPFKTHGEIMSPVLIVKLRDSPGQQLVFPSFDGYLYVVDGETGCVDAADFGEISYSMVVADDLNDDGALDLVVTSVNGNVYVFETGGRYAPLKAWTSERHGISGMVARDGLVGIAANEESRAKRDVRGEKLAITFSITDNRLPDVKRELGLESRKNKGEKRVTTSHGPYNVTVLLKNVGVKEMNAGDAPIIGVMETYDLPGTYTLTIPCPRSRSTSTIRLEMKDKNRMLYVDEFSLSFHVHWYKLIKWMIFIPFVSMAAVVFGAKAIQDNLPS